MLITNKFIMEWMYDTAEMHVIACAGRHSVV